MGRRTRGNLPNSCDSRNERRRKRKKRVRKNARIVGKKETYKESESVRLQDIKTKLWNTEGVVIGVSK